MLSSEIATLLSGRYVEIAMLPLSFREYFEGIGGTYNLPKAYTCLLYTSGSCQSIAETIASKLGVEAVDVANIDDATITSHENLLLGTST